MYSQIWHTGLDIQVDSVRALAVLRRRHGWELCHWWQQSLPAGILCDGNLQQPEALSEILRQWRVQLPKHISLRIAFPVQRVLQRMLPVPDKRLKEPERSWFISTAAAKQFPLSSQILTLDYRLDPANSTELRVTAARQDELQLWQYCLQRANLVPEVIDITPCVLRSMASAAGLLPQHLFIHRLQNECLWVSPLDTAFQYGLIPSKQDNSIQDILERCCMPYAADSHNLAGVYYSSIIDEPVLGGALAWSPFSVFEQQHLPLPPVPMAFVLAGGLALRTTDIE